MARSMKKPWICDSNPWAKRQANKRVRRENMKIPNGKQYRKLYCSYDICDWKSYYPESAAAWRK